LTVDINLSYDSYLNSARGVLSFIDAKRCPNCTSIFDYRTMSVQSPWIPIRYPPDLRGLVCPLATRIRGQDGAVCTGEVLPETSEVLT